MPPGHELNDRFHGYIRRARRTRRLVVGSLLVTCLVGASGFALEMAPPDALATLKRGMASVGENVSGALASVSNIPSLASQQLAATAASGIGDTIFRIVCTILRNCPSESEVPPPTPQPQRALTQTTNPYPATSSPNVTATYPAPTATKTVTPPIQQTVIQQPVIERIRETVRTVTEPGADAAYVDARIAALAQSLQSQIAAARSESQTIYQTSAWPRASRTSTA